MAEHEPDFLVYMTSTVDEIYKKIAGFRPSIDNFDETMIKLSLKDQSIKEIEDSLYGSH